MLSTRVLTVGGRVPDHVLSVVGAEPRVLAERHVEALPGTEVNGVAWEPSHAGAACEVGLVGIAALGCRASTLVDRVVTAQVHLDERSRLSRGVFSQEVVGLHLQHGTPRPFAAVAGEHHVDVDDRLRAVPLWQALQSLTRRCEGRDEVVGDARGRVEDVRVGGGHHVVRSPGAAEEGLVDLVFVHQVVERLLVGVFDFSILVLLGARTDPVARRVSIAVRPSGEPRLLRVGEGDGRRQRRGNVRAVGVHLLVNGDAQAPVEDELFVAHIDGAVAGDNGLSRVCRRHRRVEHRQVGEHPLHIFPVVEVASLPEDAKLKLAGRNRQRIDDANLHRRLARLVGQLADLAVGARHQGGLAFRRQGHVVQCVALAFQTRQ